MSKQSEAKSLNQLTLFAADSPVSRSVAPGSEWAQRTTVRSGQKCLELYKRSDHVGLLAKMLLESSAWQSRLVNLEWKVKPLTDLRTRTFTKRYYHNKKECFSIASSKTLKTSDMRCSRLLFQLAVSMPTSRWVMIERLGVCKYSIGSSMVMI